MAARLSNNSIGAAALLWPGGGGNRVKSACVRKVIVVASDPGTYQRYLSYRLSSS